MESFKPYNYYTYNDTLRLYIMNMSTAEWSVGYFPSNLRAVPGALNDSYAFPDDALVIENAFVPALGSRKIEHITFGITSGLVILWAAAWLIHQLRRKTMFSPLGRNPTNNLQSNASANADTSITSDSLETGGAQMMEAREFERQLEHYYYAPFKTELELYEGATADGFIKPEEVEAVTQLMRRLFDIKLGIWAEQDSNIPQTKRDLDYLKRDALRDEIRNRIEGWYDDQYTWKREELQYRDQIRDFLQRTSGQQEMNSAYP